MTHRIDTALIMAGGQGTRMTTSGVATPKPLVEVRGVSLIERNLQQLLKHGFRRIFVSVHENAREIRALVDGRLSAIARNCGAQIETLTEHKPLGNIGAVQLLPDEARTALIVYADNLTTLDLTDLARHHQRDGAAMTIAAHLETFRMPFGELHLDAAGRLVDYVEKPLSKVLICSALAVISPAAVAAVPLQQSFGISELCRALAGSPSGVSTYRHDALWIDVNDRASLLRAEALVADVPELDLWAPDAAISDEVTVALGPHGVGLMTGECDRGQALLVFDHALSDDATLLRCHVVAGHGSAPLDPALERRVIAAMRRSTAHSGSSAYERA